MCGTVQRRVPTTDPRRPDSRTLALEHEFEVDEEICEGLCNQRYAAKLILSMQLEGDEISERAVIRNFVLEAGRMLELLSCTAANSLDTLFPFGRLFDRRRRSR